MVQILLPPRIVQRLVPALVKAGTREIGGILMAEHVAENVFRIKEITIQQRGGSFAAFSRSIQSIITPLRNFFHMTHNDFRRFNYLGEWHSHPSFIPEPSSTDHQTMRNIIKDPHIGAHFVVLMIVKLNQMHELEGTATVYQPGRREFKGELVQEATKDD